MKVDQYRVAVVGFDLTKMDDAIINYLPVLLKAIKLERVVFVHVAKTLELPDEILEKYPDLIAPIDESIASDIEQKVAPCFEGISTSYDVVVQEGIPIEQFLKIAKIKNADLIVMGRKKQLEGSGLLAGHIVRKSHTSILFIPENHSADLRHILIPIDFSRHSNMAFELASGIQKIMNIKLSCTHVYHVPIGYHKTGKTHDEFAQIMKSHAEKDFAKFLSRNSPNKDCVCEHILAKQNAISHQLYEHARNIGSDLIIIGSRGRTKSAALLIGSIVEKLVFEDEDIPILVVKNKGENMNFFEALMNI